MDSRAKLLQIAAKLLHRPEYPDPGRTGIELEIWLRDGDSNSEPCG
jgi:hypothetical protein